MAPNGRTPFTTNDGTNLIKYLAVYWPKVNGRLGSKIYEELVENTEGRWPWSQRHPPSSWREHYKNNSDEFNRRIRKYQIEKGLVKTQPTAIPSQHSNTDNASRAHESDKRKRKAGSTLEHLHEAKRPKESGESSAAPSNETQNTAGSSSQVKPTGTRKNDQLNVYRREADEDTAPEHLDGYGAELFNQQEELQVNVGGGDVADEDGSTARMDDDNVWERGKKALDRLKRPPSPVKTGSNRDLQSSPSVARNGAKGARTDEKIQLGKSNPKPRLASQRRAVDEDPFISSSNNSPVPATVSPHSTRKPPQYRDGPFRVTIDIGRPNSAWPPSRHRNRSKLPPSSSALMPPPNIPASRTASGDSKEPQPSVPPLPPALPVPQYVVVSTAASSSKTQLPPSTFTSIDDAISAFESPTKPSGHLTPNETSVSAMEPNFRPSIDSTQFGVTPRQMSPEITESASRIQDNQIGKTLPRKKASVQSNNSFEVDSAPPSGREFGGNTGGSTTIVNNSNDIYVSGIGDGNPFTTEGWKMDEKRKGPLLYEVRRKPHERIEIPHIDLREVASGSRSRRQSSVASSKTTSTRDSAVNKRHFLTSYNSRRSSSMASAKDLLLFQDAGHKSLAKIAQRYGFDVNVALKAYETLKNLDATGAFLSKLRDKAELAGRDLLKQMEICDESKSESDNDDLAYTPPLFQKDREAQNHQRRSSGPRQSLSIRPILDENDDHMSDYDPPRKSRAARYTRSATKKGQDPASVLRARKTSMELLRWNSLMPFSQTPNALLEERSLQRRSDSPLRRRSSSFCQSLSPFCPSRDPTIPPSSPPNAQGSLEWGLDAARESLTDGKENESSSAEVEERLIYDGDADEGADDQAMEVDVNTRLDPKAYFAALPPHQLNKQRELINFATTVNRGNAAQMREWEAEQDPEHLKEHQAFLLETLRHRIEAQEAAPFNFDNYF